MALVSMPPTTTIFRITPISQSDSLSFTSQSPTSSNNLLYMHPSSQIHSPFSHHESVLIRSSFCSRRTSSLLTVPFNAKSSQPAGPEEEGEEGSRALETVLKLYTAIKNRSIGELSDIIGDDCRCVSNFFSIFQPFQGKKQVLDFFSFLLRSLGNNIEFVVRPTLHDGMNVGISWRLECNKTHVPLGKGFSFHICQVYYGKVIIRNVEMFMEPLLHMEPFRLKMMGYMTTIMERMSSNPMIRNKAKRAGYILLTAVFIVVASLLFFKFSRHQALP